MRREIALGSTVVAAAAAVFVGTALGSPTASEPPSISGTPAFDSVLTCQKGRWSPDAVSFTYAWAYAGGAPVFATGRQWRADAPRIDYGVICQVTAHDAQGATTVVDSPQVVIKPGVSTVRITKITGSHGSVVVTGVAGPAPALAPSKYGKAFITLDRRLNKTTLTQLGNLETLTKRNGHFTISGKDSPGRHTYVIQFDPAPTSNFAATSASKAFTLHR